MLRRSLISLLVAAPVTAFLCVASPQATADPRHDRARESSRVLLAWQRTAIRTIYTEPVPPTPVPVGVLFLGFTSLAMDDAVETAGHRHHTSASAAAAQAAHDVLLAYFPDSAANLQADLTATLADLPPGPATDRGVAVGEAAADEMIAGREEDGRGDPKYVYSKPEAPGVWQPPQTGMLAPWLGFVRPLVLDHVVGASGPDPLRSKAYARDYNEVRRLGSTASIERTPWQTDTALFFNSNSPILLTEALLTRLEADPMGVHRTAHLFGEIYGAMADAVISCWRLKYDVGFWRPYEAVAGAATDGNHATEPEAGWTSLLSTPPYSDYVSGHANATGAAAAVLRHEFGDRFTLTLHSYNPDVVDADRTYHRLSKIERHAFNSRIWGGLHFRKAMRDGYRVAHVTAHKVIRRLG